MYYYKYYMDNFLLSSETLVLQIYIFCWFPTLETEIKDNIIAFFGF